MNSWRRPTERKHQVLFETTKLLQGPKIRIEKHIWKNTKACFLWCCFHLNFPEFWPSGAFIRCISPDADVMAFSCSQRNKTSESHRSGNESVSPWSSVKVIHRLTDRLPDRPTDRPTGRLSVLCICVVLRYSKRNWMIRQRVCFIIRYHFFIWEQWDHVETMCVWTWV